METGACFQLTIELLLTKLQSTLFYACLPFQFMHAVSQFGRIVIYLVQYYYCNPCCSELDVQILHLSVLAPPSFSQIRGYFQVLSFQFVLGFRHFPQLQDFHSQMFARLSMFPLLYSLTCNFPLTLLLNGLVMIQYLVG